jgi:hypothetical protein
MSSGTNTSAIERFGAFMGRHLPRSADRPWSSARKIIVWLSLAAASWGIVIAVGYFLWVTF